MREEPDDEVLPFEEARYPGTVTTAGTIWIVIGSLVLVLEFFNVALRSIREPAEKAGGPYAFGSTCGMVFGFLVGAVFLHAGIQTVTGRVKDTRGNGVGSIAFGVLILCLGALAIIILFAAAGLIILAISLLNGGSLITAGLLALMGRKQFKAWQDAHPTAALKKRK